MGPSTICSKEADLGAQCASEAAGGGVIVAVQHVLAPKLAPFYNHTDSHALDSEVQCERWTPDAD